MRAIEAVPFTEGIGIAAFLAFSSSGVVEVVGTSVFAELGVVIPGTSVVVGISFTSSFVSGTVDALSVAGVAS